LVTFALNIEDKIKEGQTQLDNRENYRPLVNPMVEETHLRVQQLVSELYLGNLINEMTNSKHGFVIHDSCTIIPIFYTLSRIHKPVPRPVGKPVVSGCDARPGSKRETIIIRL